MSDFLNNSAVSASLMGRALYVATRAGVETSPNPRVGCVIAEGARVVAEGRFRRDGGAHAEAQALRRLPPAELLPRDRLTAYVTLEPCSIEGRTGACAARLVAAGIGRVVVAALDQTAGVCGNGLAMLRRGGTQVAFGLGQDLGYALARPRNTFATAERPYTILKQAISADGYVGRRRSRVSITGSMANVLSHQWRSEAAAILVGAGTVVADRPNLRTRHVSGPSPDVVILDRRGGLTPKQVGDCFPPAPDRSVHHLTGAAAEISAVNAYLHARGIGKLLVEGGPMTLQRFAEAKAWDEYRAWYSTSPLELGERAPIPAAKIFGVEMTRVHVGNDELVCYLPADVSSC